MNKDFPVAHRKTIKEYNVHVTMGQCRVVSEHDQKVENYGGTKEVK